MRVSGHVLFNLKKKPTKLCMRVSRHVLFNLKKKPTIDRKAPTYILQTNSDLFFYAVPCFKIQQSQSLKQSSLAPRQVPDSSNPRKPKYLCYMYSFIEVSARGLMATRVSLRSYQRRYVFEAKDKLVLIQGISLTGKGNDSMQQDQNKMVLFCSFLCTRIV